MEGDKPKHGWLVETEGRKELWMSFAEAECPDIVKDHCVVTWRLGDCNLVISVPHAGVLGQDTAPAGNLICQSGHTIETRKGTLQYPIKTYARDAATDVIAKGMRTQLAEEGLLPHVVECHVHRSKVECNRNMVEIAVATQGKEAETIHRIYHSWISQALQLGVTEGRGSSALLLDLHGHGHAHDCVELGYRLSSDLLNAINQDQVDNKLLTNFPYLADRKGFDLPDLDIAQTMTKDALPRTWRSIVTSASRHEFTLRHLLRRQFGSSEEAVREAVIGEHSFGGCLSAALTERPEVADVVVLPSEAKPCPGKLGYYTGGHTTREHCRRGRVDTLQVELPLSLRTAAPERMEAGTGALAAALLAFHRLHYSAQPQHRPSPAINDGGEELSSSDEEPILPNATAPVLCAPPPPGPPPPPLPPPVAAPSTVQADGVGHMAMMAKSKMHAELVRKANSRMAVDTPQEAEEPREAREPIFSGIQQAPVPGTAPPAPTPPPPPPPPPPPMPSLPASRPDTSDGISHMTAMSKSQMHKELVAKTKFREGPADPAPSAAPADPGATAATMEVEETAADKKIRERKKIVQDILDKEEEACHTSNLRKLNEEKRREFFTPSAIKPSENEGTPAGEDKAELACEATSCHCEESVEEEEGENTPAPHVKKTCNIL